MLKLHGEGDPTGSDEGFSFIRVSMKDIFLKAGESVEEKLGMSRSIACMGFQQIAVIIAFCLHN